MTNDYRNIKNFKVKVDTSGGFNWFWRYFNSKKTINKIQKKYKGYIFAPYIPLYTNIPTTFNGLWKRFKYEKKIKNFTD